MYSFAYYTEEPAAEAVLAPEEGTSTGSLHPFDIGSLSPALSTSDDNLSTAGESGFGENEFLPYDYCNSVEGLMDGFYEHFDTTLCHLGQDIFGISSESPDMYLANFVEVKTETEGNEEFPDEEPETEGRPPSDQDFQTFGELKFEEGGHDSDPTITVPIGYQDYPTDDKKISKAHRKMQRKGNKIPAPNMCAQTGEINTSSAEPARDDNLGQREIDGRKSVSPRKRLYEMNKEECESEKKWIQVKRAKNTFNFHDKKRKKERNLEKLMAFCWKNPAARRAIQGNSEMKAIVDTYLPEALKK